MFMTSSTTAQSHCMRCESYVPVVCATLLSKPSIDQSSTPSYCTHPVLGEASPMQQIDTESTDSSVVASAAVTALPTFPRLKYNVVPQTRNSLSASSRIPITYCTTFYRHLQLPRSTMICDLEPTTDNYQFTLDTSLTRTSSPACCTLISISSDCLINC